MIKVEKPVLDTKLIIKDCLSNVIKQPTLSNIKASKAVIVSKSVEYDELAERCQLGTLARHNIIPGGATKKDMVWLYDNKFVAGGGRKYYEKLKLLPRWGKCPFCGVGRVSTLDHYLPKTEYPTYAVTPYNLVASCSDCNKKKLTTVFKTREEELMHPYYDDFDDEIWLKTKVIYVDEVVFRFYAEKPATWSQEKYKRAKNHFEKLGLNSLYVAHCGEEFAEYEYTARDLYEVGGEDLVKKDLLDRITERRKITKNNWRAAMYEGLLCSEDFFEKYLSSVNVESGIIWGRKVNQKEDF